MDAIVWLPNSLETGINKDLNLEHLQDLANLTENIPAEDSRLQRWFISALPQMVSDPEIVENLAGKSSGELETGIAQLLRKYLLTRIVRYHWIPTQATRNRVREDVDPDHLSELLEAVSASSSNQLLFVAALPALAANHETVSAYNGTPPDEKTRFLTTQVEGIAERELPAIIAMVRGAVPEDFPLDENAVKKALVSKLLGGMPLEDCSTELPGEIKGDPRSFCSSGSNWVEQRIEEKFAMVFPQVSASVDWTRYPGLELDREKCHEEFVRHWNLLDPIQPEIERLTGILNKNPEKLVSNFGKWKEGRLTGICEPICLALEESIPENMSLEKEQAMKAMEAIFSGSPFEEIPDVINELPEKFMNVFNNNPCRFVNGLEEILTKQATEIFTQVKPMFDKQLPQGASLDKDMCVSRIVRLLETNVEPEKLVEELAQSIKSNNYRYINGLPERVDRSGGNVDRAMIATRYYR